MQMCRELLFINQDIIFKSSRKEVAEIFNKYPKEQRNILFAMYDNKPKEQISDLIWRQLKPVYLKPFKEEI